MYYLHIKCIESQELYICNAETESEVKHKIQHLNPTEVLTEVLIDVVEGVSVKDQFKTDLKVHTGKEPPKPGDVIYIKSSYYIGHGEDDVCGGKAIVEEVSEGISAGNPTPFVTVHGVDVSYNWEILAEQQEKLKEQFGDEWAHPCPDR